MSVVDEALTLNPSPSGRGTLTLAFMPAVSPFP